MAGCLGCGSVDDAVRNGEPFCNACPMEVKRAVILARAQQAESKQAAAEMRTVARGLLIVAALGSIALTVLIVGGIVGALWAR